MEEEKKDHDVKMKKMEHEMEQVFEQKVKERVEKYKLSEQDVSSYLLSFGSLSNSLVICPVYEASRGDAEKAGTATTGARR